MRLLLDTQVFLWSIARRRLSPMASEAFLDPQNRLYLSVASYWETCIKLSLGKLVLSERWNEVADTALATNNIAWLPIEPKHCRELLTLPHHHGDPFDRLLIAQARVEGMTMLSADSRFGHYDVDVVW